MHVRRYVPNVHSIIVYNRKNPLGKIQICANEKKGGVFVCCREMQEAQVHGSSIEQVKLISGTMFIQLETKQYIRQRQMHVY